QLECPVRLPAKRDLGSQEHHFSRADLCLGHRCRSLQMLLSPGPSAGEGFPAGEPRYFLNVTLKTEDRAAVEEYNCFRTHAEGQGIGRIDGRAHERSRHVKLFARKSREWIAHRHA